MRQAPPVPLVGKLGAGSVPDKQASTDKLRSPLDVATALAFGVWLLMIVALIVSVIVGDKELMRDLAKNFVGPGFLIILGYYFGASSSGKRKDETIAAQAEQLGQQQ